MPKERMRSSGQAVMKKYAGAYESGPGYKYFDCQFDGSIASSNDWSTSVIAMDRYMAADGSTPTAYTDAAMIPTAIGTGYGQVLGNKYRIHKLKVRGCVITPFATGAGAGVPGRVRLILVLDTQPNGAQASGASIFPDWGSSNQNIDTYLSMAGSSAGRFIILADWREVLDPQVVYYDGTSVRNGAQGKLFEFEKVWKNGLEVYLKGGAATPTVASLCNRNIFLVGMSYNETAGAQSYQVRGFSRCCFVDR